MFTVAWKTPVNRVCLMAGTMLLAASLCAPGARATEHIAIFEFNNELASTPVRATIANEGTVTLVKPGTFALLSSPFEASTHNSKAVHVIRYLPENAAGPSYCEWVVDINYDPSRSPNFSCGYTRRLQENGYSCSVSHTLAFINSGTCRFEFHLKKN